MELIVRDVEQVYGGRCVLRVATLTVARGETLALVGPSGAGKSTLLRLLGLLEAPSVGMVTLAGGAGAVDISTASLEDRRRLAMVFQRPALLDRSVWDNVAYGLRVRGICECGAVDDLLARLALTPLARSRALTLSGGEMQRLALARALVTQPEVLLLDEPSANLDPYNVRLIEHILQDERARRPLTVVMVTHNLFQAQRLAQRVGVLLDGSLIECGPTEQVFEAAADMRTRAFLSGDYVY
jgi:tungstate transport system ATP-binding protein